MSHTQGRQEEEGETGPQGHSPEGEPGHSPEGEPGHSPEDETGPKARG